MPEPLRVIIIGAGLGGLCLAQGLRQAGLDVAVYERDPALAARRQGYRLHIDGRGARGLHACLPPELYELFLATCGTPSRQLTVVTKRLRTLRTVRFPDPPGTGPAGISTSVDRLTVREILATGLAGAIQFGKELTGLDREGTGRVRARFSDGTTAEGDVLIGADGTGSRVRREYLPGAVVADTGERCIFGKTLIAAQTEPLLAGVLHDGFTAVRASRKLGMALGAVRFTTPPAQAAQAVPGARLSAEHDFVMWSVSGQAAAFPAGDELTGRTGPELLEVARGMTRSWHPQLRGLIEAAEPDETCFVKVAVAQRPPPREPAEVTLVGDAIHAVSPARGSGANLALADAGILCRELVRAAAGELPVRAAIGAYEAEMTDYAFPPGSSQLSRNVLGVSAPEFLRPERVSHPRN
jgi:2-polyprenyl-6-methoxyphenol hydroxylase-like FAD-dependent oxidoreductase